MNRKNLMILNSMMRLSRIILNSKDARRSLNLIIDQTNYFIVSGEGSNMIQVQARVSISNILFVERYLRSSVSSMSILLDGFDSKCMDPIDYISSNDIKNGTVDICRGKKIVANVNLLSGELFLIKPEIPVGEDKSSAEKS